MKLRKLFVAMSMAALSVTALDGCRLLDDDDDQAPAPTTSFVAVDEYVQNAPYCIDSNGNRACDSNEPGFGQRTDVNANGEVTGNGVVVVQADNATRLSFSQGALGNPVPTGRSITIAAPAGSSTISPFTTLAQVLVDSNPNLDFTAAQARVVSDLGLPSGTELAKFDYIAAAQSSDTTVAQAALRATVLATVVAEAIDDAVDRVNARLGASAATASGGAFTAAVLLLIDDTKANTGTAGTSVLDTLVAQTNTAINNAVGAGGQLSVANVTQVTSTVTQVLDTTIANVVTTAVNTVSDSSLVTLVQQVTPPAIDPNTGSTTTTTPTVPTPTTPTGATGGTGGGTGGSGTGF